MGNTDSQKARKQKKLISTEQKSKQDMMNGSRNVERKRPRIRKKGNNIITSEIKPTDKLRETEKIQISDRLLTVDIGKGTKKIDIMENEMYHRQVKKSTSTNNSRELWLKIQRLIMTF